MHPREKSAEREKKVVKWLDEIYHQASGIYLIGDVGDYWFEYKRVVPRGFTRFLGKIAEITDAGVKVHFFTGNHDVWMFHYLPEEIGVEVYREPLVKEYDGKKFLIAHGDGLGPGQAGYKFLKGMFTNKVLQWLWARLHPNFATSFALSYSKRSRFAKGIATEYLGDDNEHLITYARHKLEEEHFDYFIFGHRHIPLEYDLGSERKMVYLGDWIVNFTYAVWDGTNLELKKLEEPSAIT